MMDHFLNSLLQIVIVLDLLGLLAYFALSALKRRKQAAEPVALPAMALVEERPGLWTRFRQRLSFRPGGQEDVEAALDNLRRVLYSYQQGLA
ncbi:MAG: hypothetical protein IT369_12355 [Candidatus Latescibacteria bacterium]|nr:hypothetical protein [Candidatus Latescibacterota bacterium]